MATLFGYSGDGSMHVHVKGKSGVEIINLPFTSLHLFRSLFRVTTDEY